MDMQELGIYGAIAVLLLTLVVLFSQLRKSARYIHNTQIRYNPHRDRIQQGNKLQVTPRITQTKKQAQHQDKPRPKAKRFGKK